MKSMYALFPNSVFTQMKGSSGLKRVHRGGPESVGQALPPPVSSTVFAYETNEILTCSVS